MENNCVPVNSHFTYLAQGIPNNLLTRMSKAKHKQEKKNWIQYKSYKHF